MGTEQDSGKFRNFAIAFLKEAKEDIDSGEDLFECKRYSRAAFFSQQAVEKAVKALLEMEQVFVAEHDLSRFFLKFIFNNKGYAGFKKETQEILECLYYFEGEASKTRYPQEKDGKIVIPSEIYKSEDARISLDKANEAYNGINNILLKKFNLNIDYVGPKIEPAKEKPKKAGKTTK